MQHFMLHSIKQILKGQLNVLNVPNNKVTGPGNMTELAKNTKLEGTTNTSNMFRPVYCVNCKIKVIM